MVTHLLADLGWVDLIVPQADGLYCSCGAAQARQWNIPNLSQPNPVREEMGHPVFLNLRIHDSVHIRLLLDSHGDQVLCAGDELDGNGEVIVSVDRRVAGEQAGRSVKCGGALAVGDRVVPVEEGPAVEPGKKMKWRSMEMIIVEEILVAGLGKILLKFSKIQIQQIHERLYLLYLLDT